MDEGGLRSVQLDPSGAPTGSTMLVASPSQFNFTSPSDLALLRLNTTGVLYTTDPVNHVILAFDMPVGGTRLVAGKPGVSGCLVSDCYCTWQLEGHMIAVD